MPAVQGESEKARSAEIQRTLERSDRNPCAIRSIRKAVHGRVLPKPALEQQPPSCTSHKCNQGAVALDVSTAGLQDRCCSLPATQFLLRSGKLPHAVILVAAAAEEPQSARLAGAATALPVPSLHQAGATPPVLVADSAYAPEPLTFKCERLRQLDRAHKPHGRLVCQLSSVRGPVNVEDYCWSQAAWLCSA